MKKVVHGDMELCFPTLTLEFSEFSEIDFEDENGEVVAYMEQYYDIKTKAPCYVEVEYERKVYHFDTFEEAFSFAWNIKGVTHFHLYGAEAVV